MDFQVLLNNYTLKGLGIYIFIFYFFLSRAEHDQILLSGAQAHDRTRGSKNKLIHVKFHINIRKHLEGD